VETKPFRYHAGILIASVILLQNEEKLFQEEYLATAQNIRDRYQKQLKEPVLYPLYPLQLSAYKNLNLDGSL
jgi:hypothetical protein